MFARALPMQFSTEQFFDRLTPADRGLIACGLAIPCFLGYLGCHAFVLLDDEARTLVRVGPMWVMQVALLAGTAVLAGIAAWLWPRRRQPDRHPRIDIAITNTIGLTMCTVLMTLGPFTTPTTLLIVGVLCNGMLLFNLRTMAIATAVFIFGFVPLDVMKMVGWMPYAPAFTPHVFPGGDPVGWWSLARDLSFYLGLAICVVIVFFLFGQMESLHRQLQKLSVTDVLTGLANRRHFMARLQAEVSRPAGLGHTLSVVLVDADHFKRINDSHGHHAGDEVLRVLAGMLCEDLRVPADLAARIGGEEFALLLPDTDLRGAQRVCERLQERLRRREFDFDGRRFQLTVSMGVVERDGEDVPTLLRQADRNLYQAKQAGRDRAVYGPGCAQPCERGQEMPA
ncbi:MAG: diguanylate cyclase [Aquabacterium sp.]|nr:MAG: diguanylate cyclase [Aquabacterium sp.]